MKKMYKLMGCGGTFDLFHKGHAAFLQYGLAHADKLLIGIASDSYARVRKIHMIESYEKRKNAVEQFLRAQNAEMRASILPLDSVYVPKGWENEHIEAILVTPDSQSGAEEINRKRLAEKKQPLRIMPFPLFLAEDGQPVSSSRIWDGVIDRDGKRWVLSEWHDHALFLPEPLRDELRKPFGEIMDAKTHVFSSQEKERLITVGDVTTMLFHGRDIVPRLSVIDLLVERERRFQTVTEMGLKSVNLTYTVQNTPGQISAEVFRLIEKAFADIKQGKTVLLHVDGEEDLTVLPIILQAPIEWIICYGQPKVGTVKVVVDEQVKKRAQKLLQKFTIR